MTNRDSSIVSQTIIKAAADVVSGQGGDIAQVASEIAGVYLSTLELITSEAPAPQAAPAQPSQSTTPQSTGGTVTIKNPGNAPDGEPAEPAWLQAEAASKGISGEVWDNRKDLPRFGGERNPKSPWFKAVNGGDGIWPPRD